MPRKTSPRSVVDSLSTIIAALGMLLAAFSSGPVRGLGIIATVGVVIWFFTKGQDLDTE